MMFPVVLGDGDTFLQEPLAREPIGSDVPALPRPTPLTDSDPPATQAGLARIRRQ
jgi:hypothetical protein